MLHGVDATKLNSLFRNSLFNTIIFQFPHSGSRESINGSNPNYVLVSDFIKSAFKILKPEGVILISAVDNDHYNNIFQFEKLAEQIGLQKPIKYVFDPEDYPKYEHTMTHQDASAIEKYNDFATWEFRICSN